MHGNQCFPSSFAPHRKWILNHLNATDTPNAWIFIDGTWRLQRSNHSHQRIEHLEYILTAQTQIGILRFAATLNNTDPYNVLYLYNGNLFSHSIFQRINLSGGLNSNRSGIEEQWWIEPWKIDHLLS